MTIRNGSDIPTRTVVSTQVCVIGSGPAGVTVAWELQKKGIKVVLIEGSREYDSFEASWPDKYILYKGETLGLMADNEPEFLVLPHARHSQNTAWERERHYGGTSSHWGGQCRPHDPVDLDPRPGYPGWPISWCNDLEPFYGEASVLCGLHGTYPENFTTRYWADLLTAETPVLDGFDVEMYQFMGPDYLNFATRVFDGKMTIGESPVDVIRNASLLWIDKQDGRVSGLRVASMNGDIPPQKNTEFIIKADVYVLACGAVENARQLLLSDAGNEHDQVGRYFMCHPLSRCDVIKNSYYLNESQARLMNGEPEHGKWTDPNGVTVTGRFIPNEDTTRDHSIGRCWFWYGNGSLAYFEMAPNPDSRITLADKTDHVFKQRRTRIDWQLTDLDQHTYETTTYLFQQAVKTLDPKAFVVIDPWDSVRKELVVNGHHIGTTRMSEKPEDGVVDTALKVHSLDNLYVAGSSVFPSACISNPTFTVIALSIRLAKHLRTVLQ